MEIENNKETFPSTPLLISLYGFFALFSLALAFNPSFGPLQSASCLGISWFLALAALAMSVTLEAGTEESDDLELD